VSVLKRFCRFWYDFFFGDDWIQALGVVVAVGITALLVAGGVNAWWLMPTAMVALLVESLLRAARAPRR
jgi:hydrogenase/urease accessory protein HupE